MTQKNPRNDLIAELKDPEFATEYVQAALEENDMPEVFLRALRNVAEARSMTQNRERFALLVEHGTPVLSSLTAILDALDLRLTVVRKEN